MKKTVSIAWIVLIAWYGSACSSMSNGGVAPVASAPPTLYGQRIVLPADAGAGLKTSAADAADALGKMTGKTFVVGPEAADQAIVLLRADSPAADPADVTRLKGKGLEPFVIRSRNERLTIIANSEVGLVDGLYFYLREIGCRWLLPNDYWTIIPQKQDIGLAIDKLVAPDFKVRNFFGTGGYGRPPLDPTVEMRTRWDTWKRRNLLGGEFGLQGHTFEAFYAGHKKELDAHPEYSALVGGKRVTWAVQPKPCFTNPQFVQMYIQDRLAVLRRYPGMFAVSVEPSDGAGCCQCENCRAIGNGSESDQVFWLGNQVAKAAAKEFPGAYVSLLAYAEHAAVPTIALEPNVYVAVVPYGFQRTGLTGDELLAAWGKKVPRMSMYDYWSIPDWNQDQPSFNYLALPQRIRAWRDMGIEGLSIESTTSAGAMGLPWYVASRTMWDLRADDQPVREEFYRLAFGPAQPPMKRMLERWAQSFMLTTHELGMSYRDLAEARELAKARPDVLARVADYEDYLHYLRLLYEFRHPVPGSTTNPARALVTYIWRIYPNAMVTTYRMTMLMVNRYAPDPELQKDFGVSGAAWKTITPLSDGERAGLMADGATKYQPLSIEMRRYSGNLVAPAVKPSPAGGFAPAMAFAGTTQFEFEALGGAAEVPLQITVSPKPDRNDRITVTGPGGNRVFAQQLPADGQMRELRIPTKSPGRYRVEVFDQKTVFTLRAPAGVPLVMRWFTSPWLSPRLYFFVPAGLKKAAFCAPGAVPIKLRDADGRLVKYESSGPLVVFDVPPGQDGRAWSLEGYKSYTPIRMLNLPSAFAFFPDTLLLPEDVAGH